MSNETKMRASNEKNVLENLKELLEDKFVDFSESVFKSMKWFNPKNWTSDKNYGMDQIELLIIHFEITLEAAKFDKKMIYKEWKLFRNYAAANYANTGIEGNVLRRKVFLYKKNEYPNLCILAEIVLCLSGSNSTVERAFSLLTLLLSDKRLSMSHNTMEDVILININVKLWSNVERDEIVKAAAERYLSKRRTKKVAEAPCKKQHSECVDIDSDEDDDDDDDNGTSGESSCEEL